MNAYLTDGERELILLPKGFYEDKTEQKGKKKIDNVDTGSDLKIRINDEKQNVF